MGQLTVVVRWAVGLLVTFVTCAVALGVMGRNAGTVEATLALAVSAVLGWAVARRIGRTPS